MKFERTRYKFGCLQLKPRKHCPDVWVLRYREPQPDRTTKLASHMIGTIEQYHTASEAWKAAEAFRLSINPDNPAQYGVSYGALMDRYIRDEMPPRCSHGYMYSLSILRPKWGEKQITGVKTFAFQEWLDNLKGSDGKRDLSPKTKKHLRSMMHILYDYAMRLEFVPRGINPFGHRLIRIKNASKRLRKRQSLTAEQFHRLLRHELIAQEPFRTMVIVAICLGLRCSELFALRWSDFDWDRREMHIQRAIVRGVIDRTKTDYSEAPVPLAPELAEVFWNWRVQSSYTGPEDFVFANPNAGGKLPYNPWAVQRRRLHPAGIAIGFGDTLGWHTFRHTYRTWLDDTHAPATVQRDLMRHADIRTTFEYGQALETSMREANRKVVELALAGNK